MALPSKVQRILQAVASSRGLKVAQLLGRQRSGSVCNARQEAFWLVRELTRRSTVEIGRLLDRDHTTVMHGLRVIEAKRRQDPELAWFLDDQLRRLREEPPLEVPANVRAELAQLISREVAGQLGDEIARRVGAVLAEVRVPEAAPVPASRPPAGDPEAGSVAPAPAPAPAPVPKRPALPTVARSVAPTPPPAASRDRRPFVLPLEAQGSGPLTATRAIALLRNRDYTVIDEGSSFIVGTTRLSEAGMIRMAERIRERLQLQASEGRAA